MKITFYQFYENFDVPSFISGQFLLRFDSNNGSNKPKTEPHEYNGNLLIRDLPLKFKYENDYQNFEIYVSE